MICNESIKAAFSLERWDCERRPEREREVCSALFCLSCICLSFAFLHFTLTCYPFGSPPTHFLTLVDQQFVTGSHFECIVAPAAETDLDPKPDSGSDLDPW